MSEPSVPGQDRIGCPHPQTERRAINTRGDTALCCMVCNRPVGVPVHDEIKRPAHYNQGAIQVWDFIVDQKLDYLAGNVIKYVARYRHKGSPRKDLEKAKAYLCRLLAQLDAEGGLDP